MSCDEMSGKPIVCAGVTIGPVELVRRYLEVMADFLLRLPHQAVGLDQAVHNYVLHKGSSAGARLIPNGAGIVSTLGVVPEARVNELVSSAVLHQYDRHPAPHRQASGQPRVSRFRPLPVIHSRYELRLRPSVPLRPHSPLDPLA